MAAPGTTVTIAANAASRGAPTDTGVWFVSGLTQRGPVTPQLLRGMNDFARVYGDRDAGGYLYDALDVYFREGGARAYVARVVGDTPVLASRAFTGAASAASITVRAKHFGSDGNNIRIAIVAGDAGGTFKLQVYYPDASTLVEQSPDLADPAAAVTWSTSSSWVDVVADGVADPSVAAAIALQNGTDDRATVDETNYTTALDRFTNDLGPGQVSVPGVTTSAVHAVIGAHAADHNRVAIFDPSNTLTVSTLTTLAGTLRALGVDVARMGALMAPWLTIPGLVRGTTRTVPPSGLVAGLIARVDAQLGPNDPAAGNNGIARYVLEPVGAFTDDQRATLNDGGVNVIRSQYGDTKLYGYRTLADPATDEVEWLQLSNARFAMALKAELQAGAEEFVFDKVDGRGVKLAEFAGMCEGILLRYVTDGSLFAGEDGGAAYTVNVGEDINPPEQLRTGLMRAVCEVRMSPFAELIAIDIVKRPITEELA